MNLQIHNAGTIYISSPAGPPEESQTCRVDHDTKRWLNQIAADVAAATGNAKYGASTVAREAVGFYRQWYAHREKLARYERAVTSLLESLP